MWERIRGLDKILKLSLDIQSTSPTDSRHAAVGLKWYKPKSTMPYLFPPGKMGERRQPIFGALCKQAWDLRNRAALYTLLSLSPRRIGSRKANLSVFVQQSNQNAVF